MASGLFHEYVAIQAIVGEEDRYATLLHGFTLLVIQTQEQDPMLFKL